jgi:hypothetical protein
MHYDAKGAGTAKSVYRLCYGLDDAGFESQQVEEICLFSETSKRVLRPHQPATQ